MCLCAVRAQCPRQPAARAAASQLRPRRWSKSLVLRSRCLRRRGLSTGWMRRRGASKPLVRSRGIGHRPPYHLACGALRPRLHGDSRRIAQ
ncbi:unnamed protein product [Pylaiella littoralis]